MLLFIISLVMAVNALRASTYYANYEHSVVPHLIYLALSAGAWAIGQLMLIHEGERRLYGQTIILDLIAIVLFVWLGIAGNQQLREYQREVYLISYAIIILGCAIPIAAALVIGKVRLSKPSGERILHFVKTHKWLILLELLVLILTLVQTGAEPRWDTAYLYKFMRGLILPSVFNMIALSFCGHICMSYTALNVILGIVTGSLKTGMTCGTVLLLLASVACFYGIVRELLHERTELECTLLTALWAFSPFVLGLAGLNYWDQWVIMLTPILIYFGIKNQWFYHLVAALIFCFVKETAVVAYAGYCVGVLLQDFADHRDLKALLRQRKYYGMLAVGAVWLYAYIVLPHWDGVGGFVVDIAYIAEKCKTLYVLNFNWILLLFSAIGLVFIARQKKEMLGKLVPIVVMDVIFVLFSCFFKTVSHARYIDSHAAAIYLLAVVGIGAALQREIIRRVIAGGMICLLLISNYMTLDPLTGLAFRKYDVGNTDMVSTSGELLSDSMVYNQQWSYFDKALNLALEDVVEEDSDGLVFFPTLNNNPWFFEGMFVNAEVDEVAEQYWDTSQRKRALDESGTCIPFSVCNINAESDIGSIMNDCGSSAGYFFYLPCAGADVAEMIGEEMDVTEVKEFGYRGWKVTRVRFTC